MRETLGIKYSIKAPELPINVSRKQQNLINNSHLFELLTITSRSIASYRRTEGRIEMVLLGYMYRLFIIFISSSVLYESLFFSQRHSANQ